MTPPRSAERQNPAGPLQPPPRYTRRVDAPPSTLAESLARFIHTLEPAAIPAVIRDKARLHLLDSIGIALAASTQDYARKAFAGLGTLEKGESIVIGMPGRLTLRDSALMNGMLVHGLEFDDTSVEGRIHPSAFAVPCALAAGAFRPYWTEDVTGVALGGAIKNVLAIAAGIVEGRGLGHNATAALITRGFAEMARLGLAMGARLETLTGLSGMGDLVLTCHGPLSRNRALGEALSLPAPPRTMECFDISHVQGTHKVASMVVWEGGKMKKADYRKFIIIGNRS